MHAAAVLARLNLCVCHFRASLNPNQAVPEPLLTSFAVEKGHTPSPCVMLSRGDTSGMAQYRGGGRRGRAGVPGTLRTAFFFF